MTKGWRGLRTAAVALGLLAAPAQGQDHVVRATWVPTPPTIDARLDEPFWATIEPVTGFRQRTPVDGAEASERTEVRVAYDENALYFALTLYDRDPAAIRRSILQREGRIDKDDRVIIALDTYRDRRNAYIFELNPFGTQGDALISDESMTLSDWNWEGVYESEGRITEDGWVLEVAIPFTTIRFSDDPEPEMGIAFYRSIRRKNEDVTWPHIGQRYNSGVFQVSQYATLTGLRNLRQGRYLEVKPFAIGGAQKVAGQPETDFLEDVGVDLKYAITSNLTLDATLNTDFAQVEADNVEINLTRFNLFFPEKREFFLERASLFTFGAARETEVFFSRRIGIRNEIQGGGRLTGQVGKLSVGVLSLRTGAADFEGAETVPGAWNSVVRARADVAPRTTVGGIVTSFDREDGYNRVAGADFLARFWGNSSLFAWGANVWDSRRSDDADGSRAGQVELNLRNELLTAEVTRTYIGRNFDPALGFVPRPDQMRWGGQFGLTPRFESSPWARSLVAVAQANHITDTDGAKESHLRRLHNMLSFQTGDWVMVNLTEQFERLAAPARIQGRELGVGDYTYRYVDAGFRTNESRIFATNGSVQLGDFWSGTRTRIRGGVVWKPNQYITLQPSYDHNRIRLPVADGDFDTNLVSVDIGTAVSRDLFANALVQWDDLSETLQANIRINWIHTPGSDLFLVLDTGYLTGDLFDPRDTRWQKRTGIVKVTYLKAF
ncbi:MAG: DUF5916 domain-containing protein [Longimicrobiales bacterium]